MARNAKSADQQAAGGEGNKIRTSRKKKLVGEVAGGTTAECVAVCCCFPCTLMNLLVLAMVKVPACICRRVKERQRLAKRRRKKQNALLDLRSSRRSRDEEFDLEIKEEEHCNNNDSNDLDNEMWDRFYGTGFWRSPSQKDT